MNDSNMRKRYAWTGFEPMVAEWKSDMVTTQLTYLAVWKALKALLWLLSVFFIVPMKLASMIVYSIDYGSNVASATLEPCGFWLSSTSKFLSFLSHLLLTSFPPVGCQCFARAFLKKETVNSLVFVYIYSYILQIL